MGGYEHHLYITPAGLRQGLDNVVNGEVALALERPALAECEEVANGRVARQACGQQYQRPVCRSAFRWCCGVRICYRHLRGDARGGNELDAALFCRGVGTHNAGQRIVIGQCNGLIAKGRGLLDKFIGVRSPGKKGVVGGAEQLGIGKGRW